MFLYGDFELIMFGDFDFFPNKGMA
jgi:hypothetical protein